MRQPWSRELGHASEECVYHLRDVTESVFLSAGCQSHMVSGAAGSGEESPNRQAPGPGYDLAQTQ